MANVLLCNMPCDLVGGHCESALTSSITRQMMSPSSVCSEKKKKSVQQYVHFFYLALCHRLNVPGNM